MTGAALALIVVFGGVAAGVANCAVAHFVIGAAARLWAGSRSAAAERREEWLAEVSAMKPHERPGFAAGVLWEGMRIAAARAAARRRANRTLSSSSTQLQVGVHTLRVNVTTRPERMPSDEELLDLVVDTFSSQGLFPPPQGEILFRSGALTLRVKNESVHR
jgi:hypothetical protein